MENKDNELCHTPEKCPGCIKGAETRVEGTELRVQRDLRWLDRAPDRAPESREPHSGRTPEICRRSLLNSAEYRSGPCM